MISPQTPDREKRYHFKETASPYSLSGESPSDFRVIIVAIMASQSAGKMIRISFIVMLKTISPQTPNRKK